MVAASTGLYLMVEVVGGGPTTGCIFAFSSHMVDASLQAAQAGNEDG